MEQTQMFSGSIFYMIPGPEKGWAEVPARPSHTSLPWPPLCHHEALTRPEPLSASKLLDWQCKF